MTSAISIKATRIRAPIILAARMGINCFAWSSSPAREQMDRPSWRHTVSSALVNKVLFNALITICSALLPLLFLLSSTCHGDIAEVAPGQSIEGRLILESDGGMDVFIEAPDSISDWVLVPSALPNLREIFLNVTASTDWQMRVSSDRPDGRLAEYDLAASEYVPGGRALERPLRISSPGIDGHPEPWDVGLPGGGMIRQGGETSEEGEQVSVTLGQIVSWTDEPLEEGQAYRIALTFTASPSG